MPSDNVNEQEIQFKKRARRRLVGAIALVLLMVTILPMILDDHAAKPPQQDIAITIPSQDGDAFNSKIIPVEPGHATASVTDTDAAQSSSVNNAPSAAPQPGSPVPSQPQPVTATQPADVIVPADKPQPEKAPVDKSQVKAPVKPAPQVEAVAKPVVVASKEEKKKTTDASNGFVVQIGVFSDPDNVKQLQQKLSSIGIKSGTEKIETPKGEKIRLRTTIFASRPDAEKALAKIQSAGLSGMVVGNK